MDAGVSENDMVRITTLLESLSRRTDRSEQQIGELLAEQNAILRDMAVQIADISHKHTSHDKEIEDLVACCRENRASVREIEKKESNITSGITLLKWVLGLLWTVVASAVALIYGVNV